MNSSACYRNSTQNGDGDGVGQCEHTINVDQVFAFGNCESLSVGNTHT